MHKRQRLADNENSASISDASTQHTPREIFTRNTGHKVGSSRARPADGGETTLICGLCDVAAEETEDLEEPSSSSVLCELQAAEENGEEAEGERTDNGKGGSVRKCWNFSDKTGKAWITPSGNSKHRFWHPTLNGDRTPENTPAYWHDKIWFRCDKCPHDFASPLSRISGQGSWCPYCNTGRKRLCQDTGCAWCKRASFAGCLLETPLGNAVVEQWHPVLNLPDTPRTVAPFSRFSAFFTCDICGHVFRSQICVVSSGSWCSYCSEPPKQLCQEPACKACYKKSFASSDILTPLGNSVVRCWHPALNGDRTPRNTLKAAKDAVAFECDKCGHTFRSTLSHIAEGKWCPFCRGNDVCEDDECKACYHNSFASFKGVTPSGNLVVSRWDTDQNGTLRPRDVRMSSARRATFACDKCPHTFDKLIATITSYNRPWCPYCCSFSGQLCDSADCAYCFNNSLASWKGTTKTGANKMDFWQRDKNTRSPRQLRLGSQTFVWFCCEENHSFAVPVCKLTGRGDWCEMCSRTPWKTEEGRLELMRLLEEYDVDATEMTADWWAANIKGAGSTILVTCLKCRTRCTLTAISAIQQGHGISCACRNKTEAKFMKEITDQCELYPMQAEVLSQAPGQWNPSWCVSRRDFGVRLTCGKVVNEEIDGKQHFSPAWFGTSTSPTNPQVQAERDGQNVQRALQAGAWVIRYYQPDVMAEKVDWRSYRRRAHMYISQCARDAARVIVPRTSQELYEVWSPMAEVSVVFL